MLSYETKLKLKDLFVAIAEEEIGIEKQRKTMAAMRDFEPYASFQRIDRDGTGKLTATKICQFVRENGMREFTREDCVYIVKYFATKSKTRLSYHDFLQIILPCDDAFMRAAVTQRPTYPLRRDEFLSRRVEKALTHLFTKEMKYHLKIENMKYKLENEYDFPVSSAFKAVDDWNYKYIDEKNLRSFFRNTGYLPSKAELAAIIRRFDLDGDAKISKEEFHEGIHSALNKKKVKKQKMNKSYNFISASKQDIRYIMDNTPIKPLTKIKK